MSHPGALPQVRPERGGALGGEPVEQVAVEGRHPLDRRTTRPAAASPAWAAVMRSLPAAATIA